jgi:glycosyltransferase involved in cell wall biosynthesis
MFPSALSLSIINIPYIFTLYDLAHLRNLEFPEVSSNRIFEIRENLYSNSLKKAQKVIVASKFEKKLAVEKYKLDESRVVVLKYLPNIIEIKTLEHLDIKKKYNLKNDYIFYPAQFWSHKNHIYILKAVNILRKKYDISIDVIFSGSDKGNLKYILDSAKLLGIDDLVHYIGFVKNNEIPFLYNQSLSLVMPTYLGPSNIPPLEAFAYETPVCYPDFLFNREEFNNAVIYMNLKDANTLVENLFKIKNDNFIRNEKIKSGKEFLTKWSDEDFYQKLIDEFNNFKKISECWK